MKKEEEDRRQLEEEKRRRERELRQKEEEKKQREEEERQHKLRILREAKEAAARKVGILFGGCAMK